MAYNCGEGCVARAIKKAESDDLALLIDNRLSLLPMETRQYIKKILFLAMLGENNIVDFPHAEKGYTKHTFTKVKVTAGTDLKTVAKALKMKYEVLQKMNPNIKNGKLSTKHNHYDIVIPLEKIFAFYLRYEMINNRQRKKNNFISHYVALGETLEVLAKKYHTTVDEIVRSNHLENNFLVLDQLLIIPVKRDIFESVLLGISK